MCELSKSSSENAAALARIIGPERNFDIVNKKINVGGRPAEFFMIDGFTKDEIMEKLHPLPYGDKLVTILEEIRNAIQTHYHPFPGLPPIPTQLLPMMTDYNQILTPYVRVS